MPSEAVREEARRRILEERFEEYLTVAYEISQSQETRDRDEAYHKETEKLKTEYNFWK